MNGLTNEQVLESRKKYGNNTISRESKNSFLKQFVLTLGDPMIKILLVALAIKTIFLFKNFDWFETLGIVIAIFISSLISTISEFGSEKAFEKLQEESSKIKCRVKRNNKVIEIPIEEIVVNDIVLLSQGDKIPADGIIVKGNIDVDESSLTGESKEVEKDIINKDVFRGTIVLSKDATMLVTKVGINTFYGNISKELQEKNPDSPLKIRLRHLASIISKIGYIGAILVFVSYLFSKIVIDNNFNPYLIKETITNFPILFGHILYGLTLCVTIIVVAVPEGLPMMITLVLSSNMKRMLKDNVLVRKLTGIETAGSLNILFSDKTGTITKGKLEVINFVDGSLKKYDNYNKISNEIIKLSFIANNPSTFDHEKIIGGNITDKALLKFAGKTEFKYDILETIPFDSKNKYSASKIKYNNETLYLVKGAPEVILKNSDFYIENNTKKYLNKKIILNDFINKTTKEGSRVLAIAYSNKDINNLTFLGFIVLKDEIRSDAIEGIRLAKNAGIQTVMVTGDNKNTALCIAKEAGLYNDGDLVITSDEMKNMSDDFLKQNLNKLKVVARAIPQDKSRLVRISQELDLVVGMTGDGVNDAPALKKADIGFAMGSGTEVAKEASEVVLLDDNFLSIAKAILYGRTIFKSIRKFIIFQLTVNMCAVTLSIIGPFIGVETPVTVIQMLWINMVMDTLAALAFSFEPALPEYMKEPPKKRNEPIINKYMFHEIFFTGLYSTLLCILFLKLPLISNLFRYDVEQKYLMTAFFGLFIFIGIFNSFNARTHRLNLLSNLYKNKAFIIVISFVAIVQILLIYFGGEIFRTFGLSFIELQIMILLSASVIPIDFLRKYYLRKKGIIGGV
ncbi:MAG: calcium-translocating P-type ATPase, PMCA-type [Firmicutes bacterium]|nr:calcium-translocating P-type ATPase, PMCA-type [Bacillota bacterium]